MQTLSVSPSVEPPTPAEGKEAAAPAVGGGREPPAEVAVAPVEEAAAKSAIKLAADPAPAPAMSPSIIEFCLLLFVIICVLATIKWRSTTQLLTLMQLDRPLLVKIKHRPATDASIGRAAAAAKSAGRAATAAAPLRTVTSEYGVRPGGQPPAQPPERSKPDDRLEPDRGGPELEDQLARIVRDQFLVPLRKAS